MAFTISIVATVDVDAYATGLGTQRTIGVDSTGRYWCTYIRSVAGIDQIFVAYSDDLGATWTEEQVVVATNDQQPGSLAIDSADVVHLFWNGQGWGTFPARRQFVYSQRTGAGWQPVEVVTDLNVSQTWYGSMAIDSLDNAHVVWGGNGWGVNVGDRNIQYRQRAAGGGWGVQEGVTDVADDQFSPAIAIDLNNNVHVAWDGRAWGVNVGQRNIQYRRRAAGVWDAQEAITDIAHEEVSASIAIDSLNNVHLVWHGWPVGGAAEQVQYQRRTAVGWDAVELVTDVAAPTGQIECTIALTLGDIPYVVWSGESWSTDPTWNNIVYSSRVGGVWETPILVTDRDTMDQVLPNIAWAMWPLVSGSRPNILDNPVFIFTGYIAAEQVEFVRILVLSLPTVTTDPATDILQNSATLNGTLNNDGGESCDCGFEWGETIAYGNTTPTQSKTTGQSFSQVISGLSPGTLYHFRAFATNSAGTASGADRTFTTTVVPPVPFVISKAYALSREEL